MIVTKKRMAWACFTFFFTGMFATCFPAAILLRNLEEEAGACLLFLATVSAVSGLCLVIGSLVIHRMNEEETEEWIKRWVWGDDLHMRDKES